MFVSVVRPHVNFICMKGIRAIRELIHIFVFAFYLSVTVHGGKRIIYTTSGFSTCAKCLREGTFVSCLEKNGCHGAYFSVLMQNDWSFVWFGR